MSKELPPLTYLTFDSIAEGIGVSQVLSFARVLARHGVKITLHTFEKSRPDAIERNRVSSMGIKWHPHRFHYGGSIAGLARAVQGTAFLRGSRLIHARGDLAAASASYQRDPWVWDMRSLWADQRIALGMLRSGSIEERVLRRLERRCAERSSAITVLAQAVVPTLQARFGDDVARKTSVVTTATDLQRFEVRPFPDSPVLFSALGTLNSYYDVPLMIELVARFRIHQPAKMTVLSPGTSFWGDRLNAEEVEVASVPFEAVPEALARHHVGLSICRLEAGVSLRAAVPTKLGEFLAAGRPVVVNAGLGDMEHIISEFRCGAVVSGRSQSELDVVVKQVADLLDDPQTPERCRSAAEKYFDIEKAVHRLREVYRKIIDD
jgi:glycosyltransferase involved in cell wall biosynthesis